MPKYITKVLGVLKNSARAKQVATKICKLINKSKKTRRSAGNVVGKVGKSSAKLLQKSLICCKQISKKFSKKAEFLKLGKNGTTVNVKTKIEADKLLKEAFPDYQKVKGIGSQNASGIRRKYKMDRYKQGGAYHKDYSVDFKTGIIRGHEHGIHGKHPHINVKRADGKVVIINIVGK